MSMKLFIYYFPSGERVFPDEICCEMKCWIILEYCVGGWMGILQSQYN